MSTIDTPALPAQGEFSRRRVIGFVFMVVGMFMAILDIQIVASSLTKIQAGLSASSDEISWVQTSYLIAEVVMIPMSGWLSRVMSTRYLYVASCIGFTFMSFMCATATSIEQMIVYRALQGFLGGAMIPTVFASAYGNVFPGDYRSRRHTRTDHRPDARRLSHRCLFMALAVPHQYRSRHHRHIRRLAPH